MRIGVKYCGGCNSKYDRAGALEKMKRELEDYQFSYVKEEEIYDYLLVICGCHVVCAYHENIKYIKEKFIIQSLEDMEKVIEILKK